MEHQDTRAGRRYVHWPEGVIQIGRQWFEFRTGELIDGSLAISFFLIVAPGDDLYETARRLTHVGGISSRELARYTGWDGCMALVREVDQFPLPTRALVDALDEAFASLESKLRRQSALELIEEREAELHRQDLAEEDDQD